MRVVVTQSKNKFAQYRPTLSSMNGLWRRELVLRQHRPIREQRVAHIVVDVQVHGQTCPREAREKGTNR